MLDDFKCNQIPSSTDNVSLVSAYVSVNVLAIVPLIWAPSVFLCCQLLPFSHHNVWCFAANHGGGARRGLHHAREQHQTAVHHQDLLHEILVAQHCGLGQRHSAPQPCLWAEQAYMGGTPLWSAPHLKAHQWVLRGMILHLDQSWVLRFVSFVHFNQWRVCKLACACARMMSS